VSVCPRDPILLGSTRCKIQLFRLLVTSEAARARQQPAPSKSSQCKCIGLPMSQDRRLAASPRAEMLTMGHFSQTSPDMQGKSLAESLNTDPAFTECDIAH